MNLSASVAALVDDGVGVAKAPLRLCGHPAEEVFSVASKVLVFPLGVQPHPEIPPQRRDLGLELGNLGNPPPSVPILQKFFWIGCQESAPSGLLRVKTYRG